MRSNVEKLRRNVEEIQHLNRDVTDLRQQMNNMVTNESLKKSFKEQFQNVVTKKEMEKKVLDIIAKWTDMWYRYLNTSTVIASTDRKV